MNDMNNIAVLSGEAALRVAAEACCTLPDRLRVAVGDCGPRVAHEAAAVLEHYARVIERLRAENEALQKDKERLDAIARTGMHIVHDPEDGGCWHIKTRFRRYGVPSCHVERLDLRAAIDTAIAQQQRHG